MFRLVRAKFQEIENTLNNHDNQYTIIEFQNKFLADQDPGNNLVDKMHTKIKEGIVIYRRLDNFVCSQSKLGKSQTLFTSIRNS